MRKTDAELIMKIYSQELEETRRLKKWLYDKHLGILREYEKEFNLPRLMFVMDEAVKSINWSAIPKWRMKNDV